MNILLTNHKLSRHPLTHLQEVFQCIIYQRSHPFIVIPFLQIMLITCNASHWYPTILVLAGIEIIFFIELLWCCFSFVTRTVLLTQGCVSYCWTALAKCWGLSAAHIVLSESRLGVGKEGTELGLYIHSAKSKEKGRIWCCPRVPSLISQISYSGVLLRGRILTYDKRRRILLKHMNGTKTFLIWCGLRSRKIIWGRKPPSNEVLL